MQWMIDDFKAGWSGFSILNDEKERIRREIREYNGELRLARKLNRSDIVKRLERLRENEINTLKTESFPK